MKKFNIGDRVAVLDDDLTGIVKNIQGNQIQIETSEGFIMPFDAQELLLQPDLKKTMAQQTFNADAIRNQKENTKRKTTPSPLTRTSRNETVMEIDLHIEKLVRSTHGMDNYDMLNIQIDTVKHQMDFAIRKKIQKIVFIHGVGEGILKQELHYFLKKYDHIIFHDANYQKYGLGATEVYILQKAFE